MLTELEERKSRSKNILLFNIPENNSQSTVMRITEDIQHVRYTSSLEGFENTFNPNEINIYQLGVIKPGSPLSNSKIRQVHPDEQSIVEEWCHSRRRPH